MKLGLITDSHEHVEHLRTALGCFHQENVDQIVVLSDVVEMGTWIEETCRCSLRRRRRCRSSSGSPSDAHFDVGIPLFRRQG